MRIVFLTQEDPLYLQPFFESFFARLDAAGDPRLEVAGAYACRAMGRRGRWQLLRELLQLYRPLGFVRLLALRARAGGGGSLQALCAARGIPYRRIENPNAPEVVGEVERLAPDVLVSIACPYLLKSAMLALPRVASINLHHAPLPRYKGMMPTFWQLYHGERSVGVSVHLVAAELDAGALLYQDRLPIEPGETLHELIRRSKRFGAAAVLRVLTELADGTARPLPPAADPGTLFTFPTAVEIAEFHRRKLRAI